VDPPARTVEGELATKIDAPFTVAAIGDIIAPQPLDRDDPRFRALGDALRSADVAVANMESSLVDFSTFADGAVAGTLAPRAMGESMRSLGIDLVSRANNHALDGGVAGMISTDRILADLNIVGAGTGPNLQEARAARFAETPKGRIGLVSMFSIADTGNFGPNYARAEATSRTGNIGGSPGVDPIHVTAYNIVSPEQLRQLRAVAEATYGRRSGAEAAAAAGHGERFRFYDQWYQAGDDVGAIHYDMDERDERAMLASIRSGKVASDFLIVAIHAHQTPHFCAACAFGETRGIREALAHEPPDFVVRLAHEAIDNGADMFVVHGVHALAGIEIYHGKPIFYGLSNFVFQFPLQFGSGYDTFANYQGRAELENPASLVSVLTTSHFENGRLTEIVLHPVDLGDRGRPLSQLGIPRVPETATAERILSEIQSYSQHFGTRIAIRNGLGVIRVAPSGG
jgi:poly-gamma-glutamate synthesis protein (capsule biosynthesis protein)